MSAPARNSAGSPSRGRTTRSLSRSRLLTRASGSVGPVEPDDALPVEVVGELAQRPQQQAQRAALLLGAVDDPHPPRRRRVQRRLGDVGARPDQLVLAREEALEQLAGGLVAGGALVDPPEEDLHQHPGHLGGEHSLHRLVEGGHVERHASAEAPRTRCSARRARGRARGRAARPRAGARARR